MSERISISVKKRIAAIMVCVAMILTSLLCVPSIKVEAASKLQLVTTMDCSVWSAPNTAEKNRVKKIPAGYTVTVYDEVYTSATGKTFYKTAKGCYILCKCFSPSQTQGQVQTKLSYDGRYGSAGNLGGRTLIVTLITNDTSTTWKNYSKMNDFKKALAISAKYLTSQCASYGVQSEFLYDWDVYPDLMYTAAVNTDIRNDKRAYSKMQSVIRKKVNGDALREKYQAENVVYMILLETDSTNTAHNCTYMSEPSWRVDEEICVIKTDVNYGNGIGRLLPSSIAHEILHAFGAPDLYVKNETISQSYVDWLRNNKLKDIMKETNYGDTINASITSISAYYLGLGGKPADVDIFGLGLSEKVQY